MFVFIARLRGFANYDPVLVKKDCDFMAKVYLYSALGGGFSDILIHT